MMYHCLTVHKKVAGVMFILVMRPQVSHDIKRLTDWRNSEIDRPHDVTRPAYQTVAIMYYSSDREWGDNYPSCYRGRPAAAVGSARAARRRQHGH